MSNPIMTIIYVQVLPNTHINIIMIMLEYLNRYIGCH